MLFGSDMFKVMRFVFLLLKLLAEVFGDDDDKKAAKENGI